MKDKVRVGGGVAASSLTALPFHLLTPNNQMMREISILRMFSHPHVIHLYEIITTPSEIYLVMECGPPLILQPIFCIK